MRIPLVIFIGLSLTSAFGQNLKKERVDRLADKYFLEGLNTLKDFLSLPNSGRNQNDIDRNLAWCQKEFASINFETTTLLSEGVKHLFAETMVDKSLPTILVYMQIDGQPVDTNAWSQESPFVAVLKDCNTGECKQLDWSELDKDWNPDWRIYARSASDSKGPAVAFLQSLRILQSEKIQLPYNLKVIMDFQEELGSPTLPSLVEKNQELFSADALLIMDGTRPPGNLPNLTFGARGIATLTLTVFGARKDLHSGQYGNYAPNPVFDLSRLLASMKDESGKVLIPGFYEGVNLSEEQRELINQVPEDRDEILNSLGIRQPEKVGDTFQEALQYPSFNVRGLKSAWVEDEVRTIIPAEAIAEIDMRLVSETPAERQIELVVNHIKEQGFLVLDSAPTEEQRKQNSKLIKVESRIGSLPFKTPLDSKMGLWLSSAMQENFGEDGFVRMQTTGGSQPIAPFINTLGLPAVSVRIPNPDSNIHAPNENLRIGNFHEGLRMCLGILTRKYE